MATLKKNAGSEWINKKVKETQNENLPEFEARHDFEGIRKPSEKLHDVYESVSEI